MCICLGYELLLSSFDMTAYYYAMFQCKLSLK